MASALFHCAVQLLLLLATLTVGAEAVRQQAAAAPSDATRFVRAFRKPRVPVQDGGWGQRLPCDSNARAPPQ